MTARAVVEERRPPGLRIRGRRYPVVLPKLRDPRLHLAGVIWTLQILGQTSFGFRLSIAQIFIAVGTCAVLEVGITMKRAQAIVWPASAILTGNGIAFILRVPGTEHGDWWSTRGWYIFAGVAGVGLLSKYVIKWRGGHVFNPSNFSLVLAFVILGSSRAEPLDFWWGPMSVALAFALALIIVNGIIILRRVKQLPVAIGFWITFTVALIPVSLSGHGMTAAWQATPVEGFQFWWVLVTSPEILIFLFFMISDPKTTPSGRNARFAFGACVAVLATLMLAPADTEFATKVAVLGALFIACAIRPLLVRFVPEELPSFRRPRIAVAWAAPATAMLTAVLIVIAAPVPSGYADKPKLRESAAWPAAPPRLPPYEVVPSKAVSTRIEPAEARRMASDTVVALRLQTEGLQRRDVKHLAIGTGALWLSKLEERLEKAAGGKPLVVPLFEIERISLTHGRRLEQVTPALLATIRGTVVDATYEGTPPRETSRSAPVRTTTTYEIAKARTHYQLVSDELPHGWKP
jgi:hypothetical protein